MNMAWPSGIGTGADNALATENSVRRSMTREISKRFLAPSSPVGSI